VYRKLGFVDTWSCSGTPAREWRAQQRRVPRRRAFRRLNPADLEQLRAFDGDAFGAIDSRC